MFIFNLRVATFNLRPRFGFVELVARDLFSRFANQRSRRDC